MFHVKHYKEISEFYQKNNCSIINQADISSIIDLIYSNKKQKIILYDDILYGEILDSINLDWDEDIILKLFDYFGEKLEWTPPKLPQIYKRIDGIRNKAELRNVKEKGINDFIKKNKVFSYAITSTKTLSYTIFNKMNQNPIND